MQQISRRVHVKGRRNGDLKTVILGQKLSSHFFFFFFLHPGMYDVALSTFANWAVRV